MMKLLTKKKPLKERKKLDIISPDLEENFGELFLTLVDDLGSNDTMLRDQWPKLIKNLEALQVSNINVRELIRALSDATRTELEAIDMQIARINQLIGPRPSSLGTMSSFEAAISQSKDLEEL